MTSTGGHIGKYCSIKFSQ